MNYIDENNQNHQGFFKLAVPLVYTVAFIVGHQVDLSSKHFASAFNIGAHNINVYITKLYSLRLFFMAIGSVLSYIIYSLEIVCDSLTSVVSFMFLLCNRILHFLALHTPEGRALNIYYMLNADAFLSGFFQMTIIPKFPEYAWIMTLCIDSGIFIVAVIEFVSDLCYYTNPLLVIITHSYFSSVSTIVAFCLWIFCLFKKKKLSVFNSPRTKRIYKRTSTESNTTEVSEENGSASEDKKSYTEGTDFHSKTKENEKLNGSDDDFSFSEEAHSPPNDKLEAHKQTKNVDETKSNKDGKEVLVEKNDENLKEGPYERFKTLISPFMMTVLSSFFKEFLYPNIIPNAFLEKDKSSVILFIVPFLYIIGSIVIYLVDRVLNGFNDWKKVFNSFWVIFLPMVVNFMSSMITIHSSAAYGNIIINSQLRVLAMAVTLIGCYSTTTSASFVFISHYMMSKYEKNKSSVHVAMVHNLFALIYKYLFCKISLGYNTNRIGLGYIYPNFRPNREIVYSNTFSFWMNEIFYRSYRDALSDYKTDIRSFT